MITPWASSLSKRNIKYAVVLPARGSGGWCIGPAELLQQSGDPKRRLISMHRSLRQFPKLFDASRLRTSFREETGVMTEENCAIVEPKALETSRLGRGHAKIKSSPRANQRKRRPLPRVSGVVMDKPIPRRTNFAPRTARPRRPPIDKSRLPFSLRSLVGRFMQDQFSLCAHRHLWRRIGSGIRPLAAAVRDLRWFAAIENSRRVRALGVARGPVIARSIFWAFPVAQISDQDHSD